MTVGSKYNLHARAPVIYNFFWAKDTDIVVHFTMITRRFSFAPNTRSADNLPIATPKLANAGSCEAWSNAGVIKEDCTVKAFEQVTADCAVDNVKVCEYKVTFTADKDHEFTNDGSIKF